jgi:protein involved in polysaccharide export with SLBB domain
MSRRDLCVRIAILACLATASVAGAQGLLAPSAPAPGPSGTAPGDGSTSPGPGFRLPGPPPPAPTPPGGGPPSRSREAAPKSEPAAGPSPRSGERAETEGPSGSKVETAVEPLSPAERAFQDIASPAGGPPGELRQFGYNFFRRPASTFAPVEDVPVGPDYVLGPGDDLVIHVWGAPEQVWPADGALVRTVDRSGQIYLPRVGVVRVWGLSFSEVDRLVRERLAQYFRGLRTSVTLGRLRTIRVNVVGHVQQPGSYTVSSLATLTNALTVAGGPSRVGSLRQIRLLRNGHVVGELDFYDYLLRGDRSRDFRLESGDTVFVPPLGPVAGIAGEVLQPAIYELRGPTRIADLLAMAGGPTPRAYLKAVQLIRAQPSAERVAVDLDLTRWFLHGDERVNLELRNGDLVRIYPSDPRIYNVVTVTGAVKYPRDYEYRRGLRISELLPPERLLPEAHLERVEVVRQHPDFSTEIIALNLRKAWEGDRTQDIVLQPRDRITVRTERRGVGGQALATVTLKGEVRRPGEYEIAPGERLSSVIRRAGGFTDRAYLRAAVFVRESLRRIEQEQLQQFVRVQEERLLAAAGTTVVAGVDKEEAAHTAQTLQARRELLRALASRVAAGRLVIRLDEPDRLEGTSDDLILEPGDTLEVPQRPGSVLVMGAVRNSTAVAFRDGEGVEYYLNRVGGFTPQADRKNVYLVRADGSAVSGFMNLRQVEAGDTIVVPPKEEEKVRFLPVFRDLTTILGQTLLSIAALVVLF